MDDRIFVPQEILEEIIPRMPLKSIVRFRCVSHFWNTRLLSRDPTSLIFKHFKLIGDKNKALNSKTILCNDSNLHSLGFDSGIPKLKEMNPTFVLDVDHPLRMSSCNELILASQTDSTDLYVWNPSSGECKKLPRFETPKGLWQCTTFGFGYLEGAMEFEAVVVFSSNWAVNSVPSPVILYSSRSKKWIKIKAIDYRLFDSGGHCVKGVVYWPGEHMTATGICEEVVVGYNLNARKFEELEMPNQNAEGWAGIVSGVGVLLGHLCVLLRNESSLSHIEAWIREDVGWSNLFLITESPEDSLLRMKPLCFVGNSKILISGQTAFFIYDFEGEEPTFREFMMLDLPEGTYECCVYQGSKVKLCDQDGPGT